VLGDSLPAIAREKAGIFKPGRPVYCAPQRPEVKEVLWQAAERTGCPIVFLEDRLRSFEARVTRRGTEVGFRLSGEQAVRYSLAMIGTVQGQNAALVHLAVRRSLPWAEAALARGLATARLPGRMEILRDDPAVVVDGAHTPHSVRQVLDTFTRLFGSDGVLLFAAAAGKKIAEMAQVLAPAFRDIVITAPGSFRTSNASEVYAAFRRLNPAAVLVADTGQALGRARAVGRCRPLLITGSFYLVGAVRQGLYS
jgi:dihydrofolate synthase/folylpolyglutamate synthase